jgi:hypothetical protein
MAALEDLKEFDLANATVNLWVFKKSQATGQPITFTGRWIGTTNSLDAAIKESIDEERLRITEVKAFDLLAQNNEGSALTIDTLETHAPEIVEKAIDETDARKVRRLKDLQNAVFYVVKLVSNGRTIHAVRKTDGSWISKKASGVISALFVDDELDINDSPSFTISKYFDFFVVGDEILISNKGAFEAVLSYKQAHREDFAQLRAEVEFANVFTDTNVVAAFVGDNKIQLRRASAIRAKGHYKNAGFMTNLRRDHARYGLRIEFDANGRIVPTPETCGDIFRALLDHRLTSPFSQNLYNVDDASTVA